MKTDDEVLDLGEGVEEGKPFTGAAGLLPSSSSWPDAVQVFAQKQLSIIKQTKMRQCFALSDPNLAYQKTVS